MTYEEWLKERKSGIGGSDASAILGLNPYKTNVQLWQEKVGLKEAEDISNKECVAYGKAAEQHLRELFKLDYPQYRVEHEEYSIIRHKDYPFLFASLDGRLTEIATGTKGILEIKTTEILRSRQAESWSGKLPMNYYIQCLHYMNVINADFCILKAQLKYAYSDEEIKTVCRHYRIERSEVQADIDLLQAAEIEFWTKYVVPKIEPSIDRKFIEREDIYDRY